MKSNWPNWWLFRIWEIYRLFCLMPILNMNYNINYLFYRIWFWYNSINKVRSVHVRDSNMLLVFMSLLILAHPHTDFHFQASKVQDRMDRWSTSIYSLAWCWLRAWILPFLFIAGSTSSFMNLAYFSLYIILFIVGQGCLHIPLQLRKKFYFLVNCQNHEIQDVYIIPVWNHWHILHRISPRRTYISKMYASDFSPSISNSSTV